MPNVRRSGHPMARRAGHLGLLAILLVAGAGLPVATTAAHGAPAATSASHPAPAAAPRPAPKGLAEFMASLAEVESGGRYTARNPVSGAYGKYQIMPSNWPSWAERYLNDARARQTPGNQERVAAGRIADLYRWLGAWDRTAYWWLTGKSSPRTTWSSYARRYVGNVMLGYRKRLATPPQAGLRTLDDAGGPIRYAGPWKTARHGAYIKGSVHYSTTPGAAVGLRFQGTSIRIEGPRGPTRGRFALYVDGARVADVDTWAPRFRARTVLVTWSWAQRGEHWVELRVLPGGRGRVVAVDRVVIRG